MKPHQFEHQSFSFQTIFCDHDGSFIKPGHSYKCTSNYNSYFSLNS